MGLTADTAIVTTSEVGAISLEAGLSDLDSGQATIANAVIQATNWLILWARGVKGLDPSKISNTSELKHAAAFHVAMTLLEAQQDEKSQAKAAKHRAKRDEALSMFVAVMTDAGDGATVPLKGLPLVLHKDREPTFNRAVDNRDPFASPSLGSGYRQSR